MASVSTPSGAIQLSQLPSAFLQDSDRRHEDPQTQEDNDNNASEDIETTQLPPTDHGRGAYVALACCTAAQAPIWGYAVSFGIFQEYYSSHTDLDASYGAIATVGSCQMGIMYLFMPVTSLFLNRYPRSRRFCGPLGLLITVISIATSAFMTTIGGLIATQGVLYALGCSLLFSPISSYMDEWFVKKKATAYGIMWAGKASVGVAMPFVFTELLNQFGLKATLLSWAIASAILTLPTLVFLKPRIPTSSDVTPESTPTSWAFLKGTSFWMMLIGIAIQALGYLMPSSYLASYSAAIGLPSFTKPILLALFSLGSVPGAVVFGMMGDKMSSYKVVLVSSIGSALPVFLLWGLGHQLSTMIVFVCFYGFFAGGFSSTWASMLNELKANGVAVDTSMVFGMMLGGRGLGFVLAGPISGALLSVGGSFADEALGYGTQYGPMILCTGVTAIFGAWASWWKGASVLGPKMSHLVSSSSCCTST